MSEVIEVPLDEHWCIGDRYRMLLVLKAKRIYQDCEQHLKVYVRCDCGIEKWMKLNDLRTKRPTGQWKVISCGCHKDRLTAERSTIHGYTIGREAARERKRQYKLRQSKLLVAYIMRMAWDL